MITLLWILALVPVIAGIVTLIHWQLRWSIVLIIVRLLGPGSANVST
jgi:hypothetical protein